MSAMAMHRTKAKGLGRESIRRTTEDESIISRSCIVDFESPSDDLQCSSTGPLDRKKFKAPWQLTLSRVAVGFAGGDQVAMAFDDSTAQSFPEARTRAGYTQMSACRFPDI